MSEDDKTLVLHTSRSGFRDENGTRPQTQLTVIIDKSTLGVTNMLGKFQYNHTSHALSEFVLVDDGKIITATLSDAAPLRAVFMQELDSVGKVLKTQSLFNIGGPLGANCTGTMIGGLKQSDSGYLVAINTIDHSIPTGYNNLHIEGIENENRDVYLLWTDSTPYLVSLEDGTFMVLWQQFSNFSNDSNTVCYAIVDKDGNQIGQTKSIRAQLSKSCVPTDVGGRVVWYVNSDSGRKFYSLSTAPEEVSTENENKSSFEEVAPSADGGNIDSTNNFEEEKNKNAEVDGI